VRGRWMPAVTLPAMDPLSIVLQFAAVFAAAFLAFGLENLRERRRAARWVRGHLGHLRDLLAGDAPTIRSAGEKLVSNRKALDTWLGAAGPEDLSDDDWERIGESIRTEWPDLGPVLRSEALVVIPHELAMALVRVEQEGRMFSYVVDSFREAHRDVLPVWHERRAPLAPAEASQVRRLRSTLDEVNAFAPRVADAVDEVLAALNRWR
jgi:hypothetical protein